MSVPIDKLVVLLGKQYMARSLRRIRHDGGRGHTSQVMGVRSVLGAMNLRNACCNTLFRGRCLTLGVDHLHRQATLLWERQ